MSQIIVCKDLDDLSSKVATEFVTLTNKFVQSAGKFTVCLAGGDTPRSLYTLLATDPYGNKIPWEHCHFFWTDERCVPPDHPDSNYRMAREALLAKVPVPEDQIYRMPAERPPDIAALKYEATLRAHFNLRGGNFPRFDLVLLGLGVDGHMASLFPGSDALEVKDRSVVSTYVDSLKTHRLTLTLPVLKRAANVFSFVSGPSKAEIVARVLEPSQGAEPFPAERVKPEQGRLVWFVDRVAAQHLRLGKDLAS
jgi:6-phosphogluconolactonase